MGRIDHALIRSPFRRPGCAARGDDADPILRRPRGRECRGQGPRAGGGGPILAERAEWLDGLVRAEASQVLVGPKPTE